ncbi:MAG: S1C family serine protease [bacterium]
MSTILQSFSEAGAELIAKLQNCVARIDAGRRLPASALVWSNDGILVTASHVIQREDRISVTLFEGAPRAATLIGRDAGTDLAAVRIDASTHAALPVANLENLKVGHLVFALGRPGQRIQATLGFVSGVGDKWRTPFGGVLDVFMRTEIAMYPGFSGGPLLNTQGELLGMNSSAFSRHFNLAAPATTIKRVVEELLQYGRVRRGYLGIGVQPVDLPAAMQQQIQQENGLLIVSVAPDGPAEKYGLLLGDTIFAIEGQPVEQMDQLLASLGGDRIQQEIKIGIVRGGQVQEARVVVGENT